MLGVGECGWRGVRVGCGVSKKTGGNESVSSSLGRKAAFLRRVRRRFLVFVADRCRLEPFRRAKIELEVGEGALRLKSGRLAPNAVLEFRSSGMSGARSLEVSFAFEGWLSELL